MIHVFKDSRYVNFNIYNLLLQRFYKFIINFIYLILIKNFCQFNLHGKNFYFSFKK